MQGSSKRHHCCRAVGLQTAQSRLRMRSTLRLCIILTNDKYWQLLSILSIQPILAKIMERRDAVAATASAADQVHGGRQNKLS
jgi:hypothetical protein